MLKTELIPDETNIKITLQQNLLRRNEDIFSFIELLTQFEESGSIAIDANWGAGKTFFVKQTAYLLEKLNKFITTTEDDITKSVIPQNSQLLKNNTSFYPIYFDAWKYDNSMEPVLSLLYEITKQFNFETITKQNDIGKIIFSIFDFFTGKNIQEVYDSIKGESSDIFEDFRKEESIHEKFESFFNTIKAEKADKIVIFIDELDRCKPTYAVLLLERIKHYFDIKDIIFVFSINKEQLQHTIKQFYGNNFNAIRYLDRFFDIQLQLPEISNIDKIIENYQIDAQYSLLNETAKKTIKFFKLTLREIPKYISLCNGIIKNKEITVQTFESAKDNLRYFYMHFLIPFLIGLRLYDKEQYDQFIIGKNFAIWEKFIKDSEGMLEDIQYTLSSTFSFNQNSDGIDLVTLKEIYEHSFGSKKEVMEKFKFSFDRRNIKKILDAIDFSIPYIGD